MEKIKQQGGYLNWLISKIIRDTMNGILVWKFTQGKGIYAAELTRTDVKGAMINLELALHDVMSLTFSTDTLKPNGETDKIVITIPTHHASNLKIEVIKIYDAIQAVELSTLLLPMLPMLVPPETNSKKGHN
jgi:hypothetical protein